mmetsp:Transcript_72684/g.135813  ORF Transcript_72684/g.135813 Transcript_72684/m.135813 type:complete len:228 (+) Transcript_72684:119-802(+)
MTDKYEKYATFSDNAMKDRMSSLMEAPKGASALIVPEEESRFTDEGWDKYYFFSVPADGGKHVGTCRAGRKRPAMIGPNTFSITAFSPEVIAQNRARIEARGARTDYTEMFSQFKRSPGAIKKPVKLGALQSFRPPTPGLLSKSASDTLLRSTHSVLSGSTRRGLDPEPSEPLEHHGPYWKANTRLMPDYVATKRKLMQGDHRTFVDLYSEDVPAPRSHCYTVAVGS